MFPMKKKYIYGPSWANVYPNAGSTPQMVDGGPGMPYEESCVYYLPHKGEGSRERRVAGTHRTLGEVTMVLQSI